MNPNTVTIKVLRSIQNPYHFANVIYNNFLYLKEFPELMHNPQEINKLLQSNDTINFLIYDSKQKLVGYLIGEIKSLADGRVVFYISYVFIIDKYRGKQIGTKLIYKAIEECKQNGIRFILLTCDTYDQRVWNYYKRLGFIEDPLMKSFNRHRVMTLYL